MDKKSLDCAKSEETQSKKYQRDLKLHKDEIQTLREALESKEATVKEL